MKGTSPGKRRTSKPKPSREVENGGGGGGGGTGNPSSGSGIDAFLHRLDDDVDLGGGGKMRSPARGNIRRAIVDIDAAGGGGGGAAGGSGGFERSSSGGPGRRKSAAPSLPRLVAQLLLAASVLGLVYDTLTSPPETRLLGTHRLHDFLVWVKENPETGAAAFVVVYGAGVVLLLPGTPLTLGGGYVYKAAYGWEAGVAAATITSMAGSLLGSCSCFVLGRYVMRDRVRRWGRRYPLFDAIDVAVSDNGFKIMCLLYLTPILPLGPVSYMCGTTSMPLVSFASAKIAALPLMLLYVFIGASTDTFIGGGARPGGGAGAGDPSAAKKIGLDEQTHKKMVLFGLCLSVVSMSLVSHFVKKELFKIFDRQKKDKAKAEGPDGRRRDSSNNADEHVEMVGRKDNLSRRPRGHTAESHDEEKGLFC